MARTSPVTQEASAQRPRRAPLSQRNRLEVRNKEPGFHHRIVNDIDDRVDLLKEAGWEVVPDAKVGVIGHKRVDTTTALGTTAHFSVGQGVKATVMRIPIDWYNEDQSSKQAEIDAIEDSMKREKKNNADYGTFEVSRR